VVKRSGSAQGAGGEVAGGSLGGCPRGMELGSWRFDLSLCACAPLQSTYNPSDFAAIGLCLMLGIQVAGRLPYRRAT
jgi:hypothetical protein